MTMKQEQKTELVSQYRTHDKDTGSPEVQVALLTTRITELTEHLKTHRKDFASRRGLLKLVGRRTSLLRYLNAKDTSRYRAVIQRLGLRK
ncbi:MAG TPA: 30S ribosomal protein S15 [Phycisphaerae bacterium]|nr:30S ribosomal protein S15 [Phycisphaerae bacterium]